MSKTPLDAAPTDGEQSEALSRLLVSSAAGDRGAFRLLFEQMAPRLNALLRSMAIGSSDAEDLLVEIFYKAWCAASRFDPERGSARTWLAVIARRHALDHLRSRRRRRDLEAAVGSEHRDESSQSLDPSEQGAGLEASERLRQLLLRLPNEQREAIQVVFFDGLSQSEAAAQLHQPLGTIKSRIRAALGQLRRLPVSSLDPCR